MGALLIDSSTKGFTGMSALAASKATVTEADISSISPALAQLLTALKEHGSASGPTEVVIGVFGKTNHVFSVELKDLQEIQEILQWTIGRD